MAPKPPSSLVLGSRANFDAKGSPSSIRLSMLARPFQNQHKIESSSQLKPIGQSKASFIPNSDVFQTRMLPSAILAMSALSNGGTGNTDNGQASYPFTKNSSIKQDDWLRVQQLLDHLEIKFDIEIIYAAEGGLRTSGLQLVDSPIDVNFIFIRNRKKSYDTNKFYSYDGQRHISQSFDDNMYHLTGYDVTGAIVGLQVSMLTMVETFYSPIVYREQENFELGELVRDTLDKEQHTAREATDLLLKYRSRLSSSFESITKKQDEALLGKYLEAIREAAMIEWLTLNYFSAKMDRPSGAGHLIELDFDVVLHDLKDHLDENVYKAIERLRQLGGKKKRFDSVGRDKVVDEWLVATFKTSYDTYLQAAESATKTPPPVRPWSLNNDLRDIMERSVKSKFERFKTKP